MITLQHWLRALAAQVKEAIEAEPKANGWTKAFLDVRYSVDGTSRLQKIRATVRRRVVSVSVLHGQIDEASRGAWEARIGEPFYGLLLTLTAKGEVDVQFNYDVNCYSDRDFFAS
jgi:hypothetical protein